MSDDPRSDDELVTELRPQLAGPAFAVFYKRYERAVLAYFRRRTASADVAADLASETFAQALVSRASFRPQPGGGAVAWLFGITAHVLSRSVRRGRIEDRARRRIGVPRLVIDDEQLALIDRIGDDSGAVAAVERLPADQRDAVRARILHDETYPEIASRLNVTEAVARKRVSRGLASLRRTLEESPR